MAEIETVGAAAAEIAGGEVEVEVEVATVAEPEAARTRRAKADDGLSPRRRRQTAWEKARWARQPFSQ